MKTYLMTHVCDISLFRIKLCDKSQRTFEVLVRNMGLCRKALTTKVSRFDSLAHSPSGIVSISVNIGKSSDAVTDNGKPIMPYSDWFYIDAEKCKWRDDFLSL